MDVGRGFARPQWGGPIDPWRPRGGGGEPGWDGTPDTPGHFGPIDPWRPRGGGGEPGWDGTPDTPGHFGPVDPWRPRGGSDEPGWNETADTPGDFGPIDPWRPRGGDNEPGPVLAGPFAQQSPLGDVTKNGVVETVKSSIETYLLDQGVPPPIAAGLALVAATLLVREGEKLFTPHIALAEGALKATGLALIEGLATGIVEGMPRLLPVGSAITALFLALEAFGPAVQSLYEEQENAAAIRGGFSPSYPNHPSAASGGANTQGGASGAIAGTSGDNGLADVLADRASNTADTPGGYVDLGELPPITIDLSGN